MIPCKFIRSACLGISAYIRVCVVIINCANPLFGSSITQSLLHTQSLLSPSPSYTLQHFRLYCTHSLEFLPEFSWQYNSHYAVLAYD